MKRLFLLLFLFSIFLGVAPSASAYQPRLIYLQEGDVQINSPELSQAFYDELTGSPRNYFIDSNVSFNLYINLWVPEIANRDGRYSADVYILSNREYSGEEGEMLFISNEGDLSTIDGQNYEWSEYYDEFGRDYYYKGREFDQKLPAGKYRIEVFPSGFGSNYDGKYVLTMGKTESYDAKAILNMYWQMPLLKIQFLKTSSLQFFLTPFGIAGVGAVGATLIILAILYYIIGVISEAIKHKKAKTLLLTSAGMQMKEEIVKLLQKPAYDITVAFITTAAKPQANLDYVQNDWTIMKEEMGFNVQEVDIEGKKEAEVMKLLQLKDIIFVEGGNTFYLLKAMRACNFGRIIRKLLKLGKVYIGSSAGSIVAGRTIKTADWYGDKNIVRLRSLKGLNLVPFDIFCHFNKNPEAFSAIILKKLPWKWQRRKLRILTDEQAILVQGKEVDLIGKGNKIVL
jgi:peptidase E